jgi:hypothetical protein
MRDWQKLVRQRLAALPLDFPDGEDVCAEIASHLQESYEALRADGLSERHAMRKALRQAGDSQALQNRIVIARNEGRPMHKRLHQLWIPGMSIFALSTAILILLQGSPIKDTVACLGALATWLSSRAGGSRRTVLFASVFPALAFALAFFLMFPIGLAIEEITGRRNDFGIVATALLGNWIGWILVPGATLLAGGLLVQLLLFNRTTGQRNVVS